MTFQTPKEPLECSAELALPQMAEVPTNYCMQGGAGRAVIINASWLAELTASHAGGDVLALAVVALLPSGTIMLSFTAITEQWLGTEDCH